MNAQLKNVLFQKLEQHHPIVVAKLENWNFFQKKEFLRRFSLLGRKIEKCLRLQKRETNDKRDRCFM